MNISDIRAKAVALTHEGRYHILWQHIKERGHEVSEFEIKMTLLHGRHAPDKDADDRFVAFGAIDDKKIRIVYGFVMTRTGEYLLVVTAFVD